MPTASKKSPANGRLPPWVIFGIVAVVIVLIAFYFGYYSGQKAAISPNIESGKQVIGALSGTDIDSIKARCEEICNATVSVGIDVSKGMCLNNNVDNTGYACAVVVDDRGHCPAYTNGSKEVVFDATCKYVGVHEAKGEQ